MVNNMKKIFAFITLIISSCILFAQDDMVDLLNLVDTYKQSKELKVEVDRYVETTIFKWEATPKFFRSNNSYRNTFTWYMWKEYEKAEGFEKINYGKQLNKISNYYK
jgi:hypothetical protein